MPRIIKENSPLCVLSINTVTWKFLPSLNTDFYQKQQNVLQGSFVLKVWVS